MTSPNEAGYPRSGDGSGNGSVPDDPETGSLGNAMGRDVPPWQRGPASRAAQNPSPRTPREPSRSEPQRARGRRRALPRRGCPAEPFHLRRSLGAAPRARHRRAPIPPVGEAYASELPDLSGAAPRQPQRKVVPERTEPPPARPVTPTRVQVAGRTQAGPVRASMQIRRIDPWSALKVSLVLSVALFFVWMIAVAFLYLVLGGMGVWSKLNSNVGDLLTSASGQAGGELVSSGTIFGGAALIGLVNIVLLTAMATVGVFIYNLTTDLVGGIEVTLADRD